jgi:hypothetical protein
VSPPPGGGQWAAARRRLRTRRPGRRPPAAAPTAARRAAPRQRQRPRARPARGGAAARRRQASVCLCRTSRRGGARACCMGQARRAAPRPSCWSAGRARWGWALRRSARWQEPSLARHAGSRESRTKDDDVGLLGPDPYSVPSLHENAALALAGSMHCMPCSRHCAHALFAAGRGMPDSQAALRRRDAPDEAALLCSARLRLGLAADGAAGAAAGWHVAHVKEADGSAHCPMSPRAATPACTGGAAAAAGRAPGARGAPAQAVWQRAAQRTHASVGPRAAFPQAQQNGASAAPAPGSHTWVWLRARHGARGRKQAGAAHPRRRRPRRRPARRRGP